MKRKLPEKFFEQNQRAKTRKWKFFNLNQALWGAGNREFRFYGGSLLHSDQGGTYTSPAYRDEAEKLGITLSYSRKGNCYDNASMENFYGHLKSETIYQMPFHQRYGSTRKELIAIINDYIQWYNEERIQEGLGYLSPTNFFKKMNLETVAN